MKKLDLPSNPQELLASLGYRFKNPGLLQQAFKHPSYVYEKKEPTTSDNQRLEFLGDAVLGLAISHLLMDYFPEMKEGDLSKLRSILVSENGLCQIADSLRLGNYLLLGKGEEHTNGRKKLSILADTLEALIGAIYLDGGFSKAFRVTKRVFGPSLEGLALDRPINDFKSELQECSQQLLQSAPEYTIQREKGPDHNKTFYAAVYLKGELAGKGAGGSKKDAEQMAAREALSWLRK